MCRRACDAVSGTDRVYAGTALSLSHRSYGGTAGENPIICLRHMPGTDRAYWATSARVLELYHGWGEETIALLAGLGYAYRLYLLSFPFEMQRPIFESLSRRELNFIAFASQSSQLAWIIAFAVRCPTLTSVGPRLGMACFSQLRLSHRRSFRHSERKNSGGSSRRMRLSLSKSCPAATCPQICGEVAADIFVLSTSPASAVLQLSTSHLLVPHPSSVLHTRYPPI